MMARRVFIAKLNHNNLPATSRSTRGQGARKGEREGKRGERERGRAHDRERWKERMREGRDDDTWHIRAQEW